MEKVCLSSGYCMPVLGLGTWQATTEVVKKAVLAALNVGYRHIDTAYNYKNEDAIGEAIEQWLQQEGNTRENLFVTTKLPHIANRPKDVEPYLDKSLKRLKLSYVDLYLIHMPFTFCPDESGENMATKEDGSVILDETDHLAVWKEMERQVGLGKVRSIGLSNFNKTQVEKILSNATIKPACLQIEVHAALQQKVLREFCKANDIVVTAYSPLGSPESKQHFENKYQYSVHVPHVLKSETVLKIAEAHKRTPAQILLRHLLQLGLIIIPKSGNEDRIMENSKIFDFQLTDAEMEEMEKLDQGSRARVITFLFFKGVENHPEYPFPEELELIKPIEGQ